MSIDDPVQLRPRRSGPPGADTLVAAASTVPAATALFWAVKIATTGMGEAASDFMGHQAPLVAGPLVLASGAGLVAALVKQLRSDCYRPWVYWSAVAMISVVGTMIADVLRVGLGLSYATTTAVFAIAVAASLTAWYRSEGTLSIHSITTRRRQVFYWSTVTATFALGTAAGDLVADSLRLGFWPAGVLFTGLIAVPAVAYRLMRLNGIVAFWWAYVLTRPLGASFADWVGVPHARDGLAVGPGPVALVLIVVIACLVAVEQRQVRAGQELS